MDILYAYISASKAHFINAVFLGFVPIAVISIFVCILMYGYQKSRKLGSLWEVALLFSVVGAVLGLMMGASREPAVLAFLPAIVTLIASVIFYALPKEESFKSFRQIIAKDSQSEDPRYKAEFVIASIISLMLSASLASFWGGSVRGVKEQASRDYEEWRIKYEKIEIPSLQKKFGLLTSPATENEQKSSEK